MGKRWGEYRFNLFLINLQILKTNIYHGNYLLVVKRLLWTSSLLLYEDLIIVNTGIPSWLLHREDVQRQMNAILEKDKSYLWMICLKKKGLYQGNKKISKVERSLACPNWQQNQEKREFKVKEFPIKVSELIKYKKGKSYKKVTTQKVKQKGTCEFYTWNRPQKATLTKNVKKSKKKSKNKKLQKQQK